MGLDRLVTGFVGSNPAQGMDVCPRVSCCVVCRLRLRDGATPVEGGVYSSRTAGKTKIILGEE
jgi:hypothetical protein